MKHDLAWSKEVLTDFIQYGNLTEEQRKIMRLRTADNTDLEIAHDVGISVSTYYRRVKELKSIYDRVQKEHPEMPPRNRLNEKLFIIDNSHYGIEFVNNCNFDKYYIELKIIQKKKKIEV